MAAAGLAVGVTPAVGAQAPIAKSTSQLIEVNSDVEAYLRVLQLTGDVPFHIWSVREFSQSEAASLLPDSAAGPWRKRVRKVERKMFGFRLLSPEAKLIENTSFPYGFNEGPIWAGRGVTVAASAGFMLHAGPLSVTAEPTAFRAQNQSFTLAPNGETGRLAFADQVNPTIIDRPQRFGDGPYQRFDLGQSAIRLELPFVSAGASTADQHWGPAVVHPLILGNNAPGYYHVYLGTSGPLDLWLFKINARAEAGRLDQSQYSSASDTAQLRLMTGTVASITPRHLSNLEFGAARFFHSAWSGRVGLHDLLDQQIGLFGSANPNSNQIASLFARAVFPGSGVELYGEFARDDANLDRRDITLEPDHISGYTVGLQKAYRSETDGHLLVLRAEVINTRVTSLEFARPQAPFYVHTTFVQGHTERGAVLGSAAGYGGGGWNLAADRYTSNGKWSFAWDRIARSQPTLPSDPRDIDVFHSLSVKREAFGSLADLSWGVTLTREFNRDLTHDATNARLEVGTRVHW